MLCDSHVALRSTNTKLQITCGYTTNNPKKNHLNWHFHTTIYVKPAKADGFTAIAGFILFYLSNLFDYGLEALVAGAYDVDSFAQVVEIGLRRSLKHANAARCINFDSLV